MSTHVPAVDGPLVISLLEKVASWEQLFTPIEYVSNGPEDWFYYFFTNAKYAVQKGSGGKTALKQAAVAEVMLDLFDINPEYMPKAQVDVSNRKTGSMSLSDISGGNPMALLKKNRGKSTITITDKRVFCTKTPFSQLAMSNAGKLRDAMCVLLEAGFKRLIADPNALLNPGSLSIDDQERFKRQMDKEYLINVRRSADSICWRGDLRSWKEIWDKGGITRRVENKEEFDKFNISQPWHPFSDPDYSKYYWFRLAQGDNCYHATLSIGVNSNWKAVVAFPKIGDLRKRPEYIGTVEATIDTPGPTGKTTIELEATCTTLYLFVAGGLSVNTKKVLEVRNGKYEQDKQNKSGTFPEFGVKGVPFDAIYGWAKVIRLWHDGTDAAGFTLFVMAYPFTSPQYKNQDLNERLFGEARPALELAFRSIADVRVPICAAWGPTGYTEAVSFKWPAANPNDPDKRIAGKIKSWKWTKRPVNA